MHFAGPERVNRTRLIGQLAAGQAGVVSRTQLLALGVTSHQVDRGVQIGWLAEVHRGVYCVGHARSDWPSRHHAALLASGSTAALFRSSAGLVHDLPAPDPRWPEVTIWHERVIRRPGLVTFRSRTIDPDRDVTTVGGLRVTTIARTLVDLAAVLPASGLERAVERAEFRGQLDREAVVETLDRAGRPKGSATLRALLGRPLTGSALERRALETLLRVGVLPPHHQHLIRLAQGLRIRVDFAWPDQRVVLEVDGPHHRRPVFVRKDAERDRALTALGWRVVRLRHDQDPLAVCDSLPHQRSSAHSAGG